MPDPSQPIDRPAVYRILLGAFGIWAAHFIVSYGAALIFPGQALARLIAVGALVLATLLLVLAARRYRHAAGTTGLAALGIALAAIVFGTLPAVLN